MKILAVHNYHRKGSASGDDQVFKCETELLEEHGIHVAYYSTRNDEFDNKGIFGKMAATFGMLWSFRHYRNIKHLIEKEKPDIVHVHTFFPLLSPSILYAAKRSGCKVAATLHDTRFICPCATSLRGTEICNRCGDGRYLRMARYGCFKNSKLQSALVAFIFKYHWLRKSFYRQIDCYICLNNNQIALLKKIGFDKEKIVKKYNFVADTEDKNVHPVQKGLPKRYVVYYGRIGEEKGISVLTRVWEKLEGIPLVVMGGGPLEKEFKQWAQRKPNVYYLGYTPHETCLSIVRNSEFVVFPSIWYEGCSMVVIETESLGKPLVVTDLGFSREAINDGVNGFKFPLHDDDCFIERITYLWKNPEQCAQMGENARSDYEKKYTKEDNFRQLKSIYDSIIE